MMTNEIEVKTQLEGTARRFGLRLNIEFTSEDSPLRPPFFPSISTRLPSDFKISRSLLELFERDEVTAAFLPEIAHVKFKHYLKDLTLAIVPPLLVLLVFQNRGLFFLILVGMGVFALWFHRRFEFEADLFAARTSSPRAMVNVLRKATMGGESEDFFYRLSHPRVEDRIENIKTDFSHD